MSLCYISPQQKEWGISELTQDFKKKSHNKVTGFSHPGVREGDSTDLQMKSKNPHFEVHSPGTTTAKFYMKFQKLSMHIQVHVGSMLLLLPYPPPPPFFCFTQRGFFFDGLMSAPSIIVKQNSSSHWTVIWGLPRHRKVKKML